MAAQTTASPGASSKIAGPVLIAYIIMVFIGGSNAVAVKFSNAALPPFWGASLRFLIAGVLFWAVVALRRIPLPKGRDLWIAVLAGLLNTGLNYALLYWAILTVPASLTMIILSLGPLFTFFLAWAHGQEAFRWRGLIGSIIAFGGIVIAAGMDIGDSLPLLSVLAVVAAAIMISEGSVLIKFIPDGDPMAINAIAATVGTPILLVISLIAGEAWSLPSDTTTWFVTLYLAIVGSFILFYLFLYVLQHLTASATSYSFLLFPIMTAILAATLAGEAITPRFLIGGAVVLIGVWLGAFAGRRRKR